jgi:hypothetical protein
MSFINLSLKFEMPEEEPIVVYDAGKDEQIIQTRATLLTQIVLLIILNQIQHEQY